MSEIEKIARRLEGYVYDDGFTIDELGTQLVSDTLARDDFDDLAEKYPEIGELADRGSDMEWQGYEEDRVEVRHTFEKLKKRVADEQAKN